MADNYDQIINDESNYGLDMVVIRLRLSQFQNFFLPDPDGSIECCAIFKKMTVEDSLVLDKLSYIEKTTLNGLDISSIDYSVYKYLLLRRCLVEIDGYRYERKNGWITEKDWDKIRNYNAMVLNSLLSEFEETTVVSESESKLIERQAVSLFGVENGKVANPHPSISMYCSLQSIWDKFGITLETLKLMKSEDYLKIREIMSKEADIMLAERKKK